MKNADFRRFLDEAPAAKPEKEPKEPKAKKKKKKPQEEEGKEEERAPKYRDRAAERRQGHDQEEGMEEYEALTAEQSKFLGGDLERTHLVKGLDLLLLEKTKAEQEAKARANIAHVDDNDDDDNDDDDDNGKNVDEVADLASNLEMILFGVGGGAHGQGRLAALFEPGRMGYVFDVSKGPYESDVPTTVVRSFMVKTVRHSAPQTHPSLLEEMKFWRTYSAKGGKGYNPYLVVPSPLPSTSPPPPVQTPPPSRQEPEDDENIFSSSGEEEIAAVPNAAVPVKGSYFGGNQSDAASVASSAGDVLAHALGIGGASDGSTLQRKIEAAVRAEEKKEKREIEAQERSKLVAEKESGASGAYGSYLKRGERDLAKGEEGEEQEPRAKISKIVVEEDDEVDDAAILSEYRKRITEDLEGVVTKKERTKKKKSEKQKVNQDLQKLEKFMEKKKKKKSEGMDDQDEEVGEEKDNDE